MALPCTYTGDRIVYVHGGRVEAARSLSVWSVKAVSLRQFEDFRDHYWINETKFGSGLARALVTYIDNAGGQDASVPLDCADLSECLEFTEAELRETVAHLIAHGFARVGRGHPRSSWADRDVLQLLTPTRLAYDAWQIEQAREKEEARAAKIALRGGQVYRAPIPQQTRAFVFDRDGHACRRCAATNDLTLDHISPWSTGGPDTPDNLQVLCRPCNSSKGDRA